MTPSRVDASRLAPIGVLADLPAAELDELASVVKEVELETGATFITVDDYGTAVYFIEQGEAEVQDSDRDATYVRGAELERSLRSLGLERADQ